MDWNLMFSSMAWMSVLAAVLSIVVIFILRRFVFGNENIKPKTKEILRNIEGLIYTAFNYVEKQGVIGKITGSNKKAEAFVTKFAEEYRARYSKDPTQQIIIVAKDFVETLIYGVNYNRNSAASIAPTESNANASDNTVNSVESNRGEEDE